MFEAHIASQLQSRKDNALLRSRRVCDISENNQMMIAGEEFTNFSSNDYLAIAQDSSQDHYQKTLLEKLEFSGAMASPLVTGRSAIHEELEQKILDWVKAPAHFDCLLFSSGFAANNSVINTLFNHKSSNALLFQDRLNHASLLEGGKNSQASGHCRQYRFKHNDMDHLQQLISDKMLDESSENTSKLVVTEGVFSMDGDAPDLKKLVSLTDKENSWLMLDDAHGIGVLGDKGAGSLASQNIAVSNCNLLVITFGKAIGSQGAAVIADAKTIDYLVNFSREYIYSTHLSPIQAQLTINNIDMIQTQPWRQQKLNDNIALFKHLMQDTDYELMPSDSPIQPVLIGDEAQALTISEHLKRKGVWANAMRYPTVAKGQARLRVTITASHTSQQIKHLVESLTAAHGHYSASKVS